MIKTKRKTKDQRDAEAKEALRQRLDDLYIGAVGERWDGEIEPWPEDFVKFVLATQRAFQVRSNEAEGVEGNEWLWGLYNLDSFRTPEAACEFLYDHGVRA